MRRSWVWVGLTCLTAVMVVLLGGQADRAQAGALARSRITPALARIVARSKPRARLRVIVMGEGAASAALTEGKIRTRLRLVPGVAATVRARDLPRLAARPGVSLVAPDAPVRFATAGAV